MTFTHFITDRAAKKEPPSFLAALRHPRWPKQSNRLEDFETFLLSQLEEEAEDAISELRGLWHDFAHADPEGKHDLDLVACAWAEYARHLRTCSGTGDEPCGVSQELIEHALEVSSFDDLNHPMREATACTGPDERDEDDDPPEDDGNDEDDDDQTAELF